MIDCLHSSLSCNLRTTNSSVTRCMVLGLHSCHASSHRLLSFSHPIGFCRAAGNRRQPTATRVCSLHSTKRNCRQNTGAQARGAIDNSGAGEPTRQQVWTLPTLLTVCRVLAIPILIAVWFSQSQSASQICCGIFLAASFTDFLDGYLARKMGLTSNFGAFLDPVADKLMVAAVLILLSSHPLTTGPLTGNPWILPVISSVIIGREIAMSALRELAASLGGDAYSAVAVSSWGKWKTATQMASLTLMLLTAGGTGGAMYSTAASLGLALLFLATLLTVLSLVDYLRGIWKYLQMEM